MDQLLYVKLPDGANRIGDPAAIANSQKNIGLKGHEECRRLMSSLSSP